MKTLKELWSRKKNFSFIPAPSLVEMGEPVLIFAGIGVVLVGLALKERKLVKQGKEYEAENYKFWTRLLLPVIAIGGAMYVLVKAGGVFL